MRSCIARCAERLCYAVRYLANGSCGPQEKLTRMYRDTRFGADEPKAAVNIAAMPSEQARKVIGQICSLSEAAAYALGRQSNFER
jgi:hypothetical protein